MQYANIGSGTRSWASFKRHAQMRRSLPVSQKASIEQPHDPLFISQPVLWTHVHSYMLSPFRGCNDRESRQICVGRTTCTWTGCTGATAPNFLKLKFGSGSFKTSTKLGRVFVKLNVASRLYFRVVIEFHHFPSFNAHLLTL